MRLPALAVPSALLILMGAAVAAPGQELQGGLAQTPPQITRVDTPGAPQTTEAAPQPFGYESEVHCFGYIGSDDEQFVAAGHDRGLKPGDEFWLVTPEAEIVHPITNTNMGRFYQNRGRATVICIEGRTATLRVTLACTDIPMGVF